MPTGVQYPQRYILRLGLIGRRGRKDRTEVAAMATNAAERRLLKRLGWTEEQEHRHVEAYLRQGNNGPYYELGSFYRPAGEGSAEDAPYREDDVNWLVNEGYISREPSTEPTTYRLALTDKGRSTVHEENLLTE